MPRPARVVEFRCVRAGALSGLLQRGALSGRSGPELPGRCPRGVAIFGMVYSSVMKAKYLMRLIHP